jgi:uncharacterized protein
MSVQPVGVGRAGRPRSVGPFVLLAYGLTWAWVLPIVLTGGLVEPGRGWPTHFPSLLGPMVAALLVAARFGELCALVSRMARVRVHPGWWLVALSPLGLALVGLLVTALSGGSLPRFADFGVMSGLWAAWGPVLVGVVIVLVNGFGEETGWRGYALPALQRRFGPLTAMLVLAVIWAGWHAPLFLVLTSFRDFGPAITVGWVLGLVAGSIVLGWLYNRTGSIAVVAVWHGLFNIVSGTAAATGLLAAVVSTGVMVWALVLVGLEVAARRRGKPTVLGPMPTASAVRPHQPPTGS